MFFVFLQKLLASVLLFAQAVMLPLASISTMGTAAVAQASSPQTQSQTILTGYNITSPTLFEGKIWFSGMLDASMTSSAIYQAMYDSDRNEWNTQKVFSLPGYQVSDPSIINNGGDLFMYYTKISNTDAVGTSTALKNQIGLAYSQDDGNTWMDQRVVIAQQNGIDARGGWAPSAMVVGSEIWLYFSTNGPGAINVYRARFNLSGQLLSTDPVYYGDGTTTPLSAFNVDVAVLTGMTGYSMLANTDLSSISQYTSIDGLHWKIPDGSINPLVTASADMLLGAPSGGYGDEVVPNIYFSEGSLAEKRWSSIQVVSQINSQTGAALASSSSASNLSSDTGSNSSGSSGALVGLGLLGVAGIAAFALFGGTAVVADAGAEGASAAREAAVKSFGGRVVSINVCLGGLININILPAGLFPISYVWAPSTITFLAGPPTHIGQEVLGLALLEAPVPCIGFGTHPPIWAGFLMVDVGTSPI